MIPGSRRGLVARVLLLVVATPAWAQGPMVTPPAPGQQRVAPAPAQQPAQEPSNVLGRRLPAPVQPPTPRQHPDVHVGVVSPRASSVFGRRSRSRCGQN